jgi:hypothetical protein
VNIVDYDKLLELSAFLSCDVLHEQFACGLTRHAAVAKLVSQLGFDLHRFKLGGWYAVTIRPQSVQAEIDLYRDNVDYDRAGQVDYGSRLFVIGADLHSCELGALTLALDAEADIWLDEPKLCHVYSQELLQGATSIGTAIWAYIKQWLWFGDVPQTVPYWRFAGLQAADAADVSWRQAFEDLDDEFLRAVNAG